MIFFIHIPKTGGTTILDILRKQVYFNQFKRIHSIYSPHPKKFLRNIPRILDEIKSLSILPKVIGGHFGYGVHQALDTLPRYFTVLRNPIERVVSEYYFTKQRKEHYHHELIVEQQISLQDYIQHSETYYLNNLQTRLISGESYSSGDQITEEIFRKAIENLYDFEVIGITEQMLETISLFYLAFGWQKLPYYLTSNINVHRPPTEKISQKTISFIEDRENYDIRLYDKAQIIFRNRVNENLESLNDIKYKIMNAPFYYKIYLRILKKWNDLLF